jgi:putative ABC transport system permease protein
LIPESGIPRRRDVRFLSVLGRLAPHVDLDSARREMGLIAGRLSREYPRANEGLTAVTVRPLRDVLVGPVRPAMLAIFGAVALVLLIGCVNVASLLLVRAESRSPELALRTALGASRGALVRQLLTESVLLALIGGVFGLWVGVSGTRALIALAPADIPRLAEVGLSLRMLLFTTVVSTATALGVGLLPALRASRPDLRNAIDGSAAIGPASRGSGRLRATLVVTQVALVAVLAVVAGLLVRSYASVRSVDTGFDSDGLLTVSVSASGDDFQQFLQEALRRIRHVPGVQSAAMVRPLPLGPGTFAGERYEFQIPGEANSDAERQPRADLRFVSPGFFRTMGIPLLAGRDFSDRDDAGAPPVVVLSQATAKRFWPQASPVGAHIRFGDALAEVIGVVADIKQTSLEEVTEPAAYASFAQFGRRGMSFVLRTQAPVAVLKPVQKAIWALHPEQPIQNVASMDQLVADALAGRRFSMSMLTAFALLALFLAALGIYGLVAYAVGRRVREIGIRIALGAQPMSLLRLIIRRAVTLVAVGVVVGLALAAASTPLIQRLLFGVGRFDPWVFLGSAIILLLVATFACVLPAHRAARVDPMEVLRHE